MLLSVWTKEAATTLILSMFIWGLLTIVHSNIATLAVAKFPLHKPQPEKEDRQQIQQIWEGFKEERDAYVLKMIGYEHIISAIPFEGTISVGLDASSPGDLGFKESYTIKPLHKADVSKFQEILGYQEPLRIDYANKAEEILKRREEIDKRNRQFARDVSRISFADTYHFAVGAITSTDRKSYNDFINQTRSYKRQIVDYLASKNAFSVRGVVFQR